MKFCRPIYRLLNQQTPELAKKTFLKHAAFYVGTGSPDAGGTRQSGADTP
jgi:hypothetical protein